MISSVAVMAVWPVFSGVGAMVGKLAGVALHRPAKERPEWTALGGAVGCACGLLAMIEAIANLAGS